MPKRGIEPEEAIGPVVDGLENFQFLSPVPLEEEPLPEYEENNEEKSGAEGIESPVLLLCGEGEVARKTADLAMKCGFVLEVATADAAEEGQPAWPEASAVYVVPDWQDIVGICGIDRNYFVCIFMDDLERCEDILAQCLPSDARYLGVYGSLETRQEIFSGLRQMGAPDAELVAIACPMGLNIGAVTSEQQAVGIVAELMAARAGTLKRLAHSDYKKRK